MSKKIAKILFVAFLFVLTPNAYALNINDEGYINSDGVSFYEEANYSGSTVLNSLDTGDAVRLLSTEIVTSNDTTKCNSGFYKISFYWESGTRKTYTGYVCADSISFQVDSSKYAEEFAKNNIPEIYWDKLTLLKDKYPNWKFIGHNTGLNWEDVITAESQVGISYIQSTNSIYLSLDDGSYNPADNTYNPMEAGGWYAANKQTVAYYMDPRNFLNEINIFMFEKLGYNADYQTREVVASMLAGTDLEQYTDYFMQAATYNGNKVSPVSLAARSRQEVTQQGKLSDSANGALFNGTAIYNFYNIGAFSSCIINGNTIDNPVMCALLFASKTDEETGRPWVTPEKSILNGAKRIGDQYINQGQDTLYLQRFNVTGNGTYSHQYMTNVGASVSESTTSYKAYKDIEKLDSTIVFSIPVYNNMPSVSSKLPTSVDQAKIEDLKNSTSIGEIVSKSGYTDNGQYITNISLGATAAHMITAIRTSGGDASITTDGKNISGQEKIGTGDVVNITLGGNTKSYRIVIRGDANGDGEVDAVDYVKIYKYIMGGASLNGSYEIASDVNNDGLVDAVDYVKIYKHIMVGGNL